MTSFERSLVAWLREGPEGAPVNVVEAALVEARTVPQARLIDLPWRLPRLELPTNQAVLRALATAASIAIVALVVIWGSQSLVVGPQPTASPTRSATPSPSPSPSPTASSAPPSPSSTSSAGNRAEFNTQDFALAIEATKYVYRPTEPIDAFVDLTYIGPEETIAIAGSALVGMDIAEVGGSERHLANAGDSPCQQFELKRGFLMRQQAPKPEGIAWSPDDPLAAFYEDFYSQPAIVLPVGSWRLTAYTTFARGDVCDGPLERLKAEITIGVADD